MTTYATTRQAETKSEFRGFSTPLTARRTFVVLQKSPKWKPINPPKSPADFLFAYRDFTDFTSKVDLRPRSLSCNARTPTDVESCFPYVALHKVILRSDPTAGPPSNPSLFGLCVPHGQGAGNSSEVGEGERAPWVESLECQWNVLATQASGTLWLVCQRLENGEGQETCASVSNVSSLENTN